MTEAPGFEGEMRRLDLLLHGEVLRAIELAGRHLQLLGRSPSASDFKHHHRDPRANSAVKDPP